MSVKEIIDNYNPSDQQEENDKISMLYFINHFDDVLTRNNVIGHFSASGFVINKEKNKMLAVYHKKADGWTYPGGHADGDENLLNVALKEVYEETGLKADVLKTNPFMISILPSESHLVNDQFVSSHLHFDIIYLMEVDDSLFFKKSDDECLDIKWIPFQDIEKENFCYFIKPVVMKMIDKMNTQC